MSRFPARSIRCLIVLFAVLTAVSARAQFRELRRSPGAKNEISGISFVSPSTGYITYRFNNTVGYTTDSGRTFTQRTFRNSNTQMSMFMLANLDMGVNINGVKALSAQTLLLYGDALGLPIILHSDNGGLSWRLVLVRPYNPGAPAFNEGITDIEFPGNGSTGYAVHHEEVLRTTDGGLTWTPVFAATHQQLARLSFPTPTTGYVCGGDKVYKTTNSGASWTAVPLPQRTGSWVNYAHVYFLTPSNGYLGERSGEVYYRTTNGGASWTQQNEANRYAPYGDRELVFVNDSTGFTPGGWMDVYRTDDYGRNWDRVRKTPEHFDSTYGLTSVHFLNEKTGWASGTNGFLMMTTNGGASVYPAARFRADTTGVQATGLVQLTNTSRKGFTYQWFRNDTLVGTGYHAQYAHYLYRAVDTVMLVVSDGTDTDTAYRYLNFPTPYV
ncbi:MAG TPA: YCF48-related protein, partial [Chitinophagaceae bacterium]|nr:YCF48-related protein [Chitinophagaceae bacterium]